MSALADPLVADPVTAVGWFLEQEARALLTRLRRIKPFALQETMLPAAALDPSAQLAVERFLSGGRERLRGRVEAFLEWLRGPGATAPPAEAQRRFTLVRIGFNDVVSQFDLFSDVITQRSETEIGLWLSGLDVFAAEALAVPGNPYVAPSVICYLDRGPGAAIRRARTRLPGDVPNPVAIIRVPRERLIGHGIASSVVHEVGHQAAALLDLASSLRPALQEEGRRATPGERAAWELWSRWISEIVADVWSVGKLGVCSTLGLIGVVSLPAWAVFRIAVDDPHPVPWIRVRLSAAVGAALYPSPQWATLTAIWLAMYPSEGRPAAERATLAALEATLPRLAALLVDHRPPALGGRSLREVMPIEARRPPRLLAAWRSWEGSLREAAAAPPSLALAVLGQARAAGLVTPEAEARMVGRLLTWWALRGTLEAARAAAAPAPALRAPPPVAAPAPVPSVAGRSTR